MKGWIPSPKDMIRIAHTQPWSKEHPAPYLVGYLYAWACADEGTKISVRVLSKEMGWSTWSARKILERVTKDRSTWNDLIFKDQKPTSQKFAHQPHTSHTLTLIKSGPCEDISQNGAHSAHNTPARSRNKTMNNNNSNSLKMSNKELKELDVLWKSIQDLRKEVDANCRAQKLTAGRRKHLKARLAESSADQILLVWKWALKSEHSRAVWMRTNGFVRPDTLHRAAKFAGYLEMASAWRSSPKRQARPSLDEFLEG